MTVEDALAHELERGPGTGNVADEFPDDDDDDESYKDEAADKANGAEIAPIENHNWDDEENIKSITEGDLADCVQSSLDNDASLPLKPSGKASQASQASHKRAKSIKSADYNRSDANAANESMDDAEIA